MKPFVDKTINSMLESGEYKSFFTNGDVLDEGKTREYFDGEYPIQESGYLEISNQVKYTMDYLRNYYIMNLQYCDGKFYGFRRDKHLAKKHLHLFKDYLFAPATVEFLFQSNKDMFYKEKLVMRQCYFKTQSHLFIWHFHLIF